MFLKGIPTNELRHHARNVQCMICGRISDNWLHSHRRVATFIRSDRLVRYDRDVLLRCPRLAHVDIGMIVQSMHEVTERDLGLPLSHPDRAHNKCSTGTHSNHTSDDAPWKRAAIVSLCGDGCLIAGCCHCCGRFSGVGNMSTSTSSSRGAQDSGGWR